jgi:transposase
MEKETPKRLHRNKSLSATKTKDRPPETQTSHRAEPRSLSLRIGTTIQLYSASSLPQATETQDNTKKKSFTYCEKSEDARAQYIKRLKRVPYEKRVYIDESGVNEFLQWEYGRALRGQEVEGLKPGKRFLRVNVIGALCTKEHIAVECYKHSTNSAYFEEWFEHHFLKKVPKGCTAIMDNASFHNKKRLRKLARGRVRLLFLPAYSPDYNPIEKSWANMKRFLRDNLLDYKDILSAIYRYFNILLS